jgi:hypothetical protein
VSATTLDLEVVELLRESPDLLAIADAIATTQPSPERHHRPLVRLLPLAAAVVVAVALALAAPWQGRGGGLVARALAALGAGQVIHVVSVSPVPQTTLIDLRTGSERPLRVRTELWFDQRLHLERVVTRVGGRIVADELQTAQGSWTAFGRVYTCAWIAAHPLLARQARVNCNAAQPTLSRLRRLAEPRPQLDPALAAFVDGYRHALASGKARPVGSGVVAGHAVEWLRIAAQTATKASPARFERVAVDRRTLKPVLVETILGQRLLGRAAITSVETRPPSPDVFTRPRLAPAARMPIAASVPTTRPLSQGRAAAALDGKLLWLHSVFAKLPLAATSRQRIVTRYGTDHAKRLSIGVELVYGGPVDETASERYIRLSESREPQLIYGFTGIYRAVPAAGVLRVSRIDSSGGRPANLGRPAGTTIWRGQLKKGGVYVTLEATSKRLLVAAARNLSVRRAR